MYKILWLACALFISGCAMQPVPAYQQSEGSHRSDYNTFTIKPVLVKRNSQLASKKIEIAIQYALQQQGLNFVKEGGQLSVEYGFGLKSIQELELKMYPVGSKMYTGHILNDALYATLVVNIVDVTQNKSIWLMSGSRKIDEMKRSQQQVNDKFVSLLSNFK